MLIFHFEEKMCSSCAGNVESLIAIFISTLHTRAHFLLANVAGLMRLDKVVWLVQDGTYELPSLFGHLLHIHDRFHERLISE
jgi:hypothetical protein